MRDWIMIPPRPPGKPSMRLIAEAVAVDGGYTLACLRSPDRRRMIAAVRQKAMAAVYASGHFSLPQVGAFFNRDHTTVLYAVRRVAGATPDEARAPVALAQQGLAA